MTAPEGGALGSDGRALLVPHRWNEEHVSFFKRLCVRVNGRNAVGGQVVRLGDGRKSVAIFDVMESPGISVAGRYDRKGSLGRFTHTLWHVDEEASGSHLLEQRRIQFANNGNRLHGR